MKLTIVLLIIGFVQVNATTSAQRLTLKQHNVSLKRIFKEINKQAGFDVVYQPTLLKSSQKINADFNDATLDEVMKVCLQGQPLVYTLYDKAIVIRQEKQSISKRPIDFVQLITVTGKVTDTTGAPLPGASIKVKGGNQNTSTDPNGMFTLRNVEANSILQISFIGYVTQEIKAISTSGLVIKLKEERSGLNEVVVVGYGSQKKVNLTGAVSSVKMDNVLADRPITSTSQALQGAIPGLQITTNSGQPGTPSSINIRGFTSINGGSPLILVDNVPMDMDDVNPKDIASVSVLKDASASSIYGARAAFGVILITTKKGNRNQPVKFEYSTNLALTNASTLPKKTTPLQFVNALNDFGTTTYWAGEDIKTWLGLLNQYQQNPDLFPTGSTKVGGTTYPLKEYDIYGKLFDQGFEQIHNFSFSGGTEKSSFRTSLGYTNQNGIITTANDSYKRYNFNTFFNTALTSKLEASVNVFYNNGSTLTPQNYVSIFSNAVQFGSFAATDYGTLPNTTQVLPFSSPNNLVSLLPPTVNSADNLRLFGKLDFSPVKNLKISGEYTFNHMGNDIVNVNPTTQFIQPVSFQLDVFNPTSSYQKQTSATNYNALNVYANYSATIANAHNFNFLLGTNQESSKQSGFTAKRLGLISSSTPSISTSTGTQTNLDEFNEYAVSGYFGRLNYNYKNRYLFEATGRFDGSSRFPKGHQFGFFPSFSGGWNISEEGFMEHLKNVFSLLKIRGSFGQIGNQVILKSDGVTQNYYPATPGLTPTNSGWINPGTNLIYTTLSAPALVSSSFTWERVQTADIGLDIGLFSDKLNGTFDVYRRKTLDMLAPSSQLPATLGAAAPLQNVADLKTDGWEMNLVWKDKINKLNYSIGFNLSNNQATITKFDNPNGLLSQYYVGQKINEIWGYVTQGYYKVSDFLPGALNGNLINNGSQGTGLISGVAPFRGVLQNPGDIRYVDLNGDGVIYSGNSTLSDPGDRKVLGNSTRHFQFGFNGSVSYANFDFSFIVQGVGKRDLWISNQVYFPYQTQFVGIFANQLDYWTPTNTEAYYPRFYANASGNTSTSLNTQTKYLANAAYLRVKSLALGYTLPSSLVKKISVNSIRVFFSGENLFTYDHLPAGLDPEATNLGNGGIYPFLKKYSFGVNVNF